MPVPNVVTAEGIAAARAELDRGGDPDRMRELTEHLATAVVAPPTEPGVVGFGSTVTIETESGERRTYRFVGAIEADVKRGWLSFQSDVASALWGAKAGDTIELPRGGEAEVIAIL